MEIAWVFKSKSMIWVRNVVCRGKTPNTTLQEVSRLEGKFALHHDFEDCTYKSLVGTRFENQELPTGR
jgi:hypothetical protein